MVRRLIRPQMDRTGLVGREVEVCSTGAIQQSIPKSSPEKSDRHTLSFYTYCDICEVKGLTPWTRPNPTFPKALSTC
jgi:hypothetical protein